MKIKNIIENLDYTIKNGNPEQEIKSLCYDSRKAGVGSLFVAMTGAETDGHSYIDKAYEQGCRAFAVEKVPDLPMDATIILFDNTRQALAEMSANFFGHPSKELDVIGITGTKGKTSTTYIVRALLNGAGCETGLIGTVGAEWKDRHEKTVNTTPESYELQRILREMADDGVKAVAMEVSSLGMKWHRVDGINFKIGVFTNLSPDHIGGHEHKTFEEYASWKKAFMDLCENSVAFSGDKYSDYMTKDVKGEKITYGTTSCVDFKAENIVPYRENGFMGVSFNLLKKGKNLGEYRVGLPGKFSVQNALAAIAVCDKLGYPPETVKSSMETIAIPGRGEIVYMSDDYGILIDYAHNDISLKSIIETVRAYNPKRIITLFGSVGDRAQLRREELGTVSGKLSDFTIITSDDPGYEDPEKIGNEIAAFVKKEGGKCIVIPDRDKAVEYGVSMLEKGDMLLCCGKGHEKFNLIKGVKEPLDERAAIERALKRKNNENT